MILERESKKERERERERKRGKYLTLPQKAYKHILSFVTWKYFKGLYLLISCLKNILAIHNKRGVTLFDLPQEKNNTKLLSITEERCQVILSFSYQCSEDSIL